MRYFGGLPTGLGNDAGVAAGNPLLDPRFKIQGGEPWNKTPLLPGKDTKQFENQPLPAPALPPAGSNLLAQGIPPVGNAGALGGSMQMGGPNVFSVRPGIQYLNPEEGGLQLGGSVNVPLGENARFSAAGGYSPETNSVNLQGTIGQPQGAPGFGLDFFVNRRLNQNSGGGAANIPGVNDAGMSARYGARF